MVSAALHPYPSSSPSPLPPQTAKLESACAADRGRALELEHALALADEAELSRGVEERRARLRVAEERLFALEARSAAARAAAHRFAEEVRGLVEQTVCGGAAAGSGRG